MYAGRGQPSPSGSRFSAIRTGALGSSELRASELCQLGFEMADVVERPVDACESNVGDFVEPLERLHEFLADHRRWDLVFAARKQPALDQGYAPFQPRVRNR